MVKIQGIGHSNLQDKFHLSHPITIGKAKKKRFWVEFLNEHFATVK